MRRQALFTATGLLAATLPTLLSAPSKTVTGLHVLSATVDLPPSQEVTAHQIAIELHNSSAKTIVAYLLEIKEFNRDGKQISDSGFGTDFISVLPPEDKSGYILPGQIAVSESAHASAEAVSVRVAVMGIVYEDRTFEGIAATLFHARTQYAAECRQALTLLKSYPATPEDTRNTIGALLMMSRFGLVDGAHWPVTCIYGPCRISSIPR